MMRAMLTGVAVLTLASCAPPGLNSAQRSEVHDIAVDAADDAIDESAASRITALENRIEQLESQIAGME